MSASYIMEKYVPQFIIMKIIFNIKKLNKIFRIFFNYWEWVISFLLRYILPNVMLN